MTAFSAHLPNGVTIIGSYMLQGGLKMVQEWYR